MPHTRRSRPHFRSSSGRRNRPSNRAGPGRRMRRHPRESPLGKEPRPGRTLRMPWRLTAAVGLGQGVCRRRGAGHRWPEWPRPRLLMAPTAARWNRTDLKRSSMAHPRCDDHPTATAAVDATCAKDRAVVGRCQAGPIYEFARSASATSGAPEGGPCPMAMGVPPVRSWPSRMGASIWLVGGATVWRRVARWNSRRFLLFATGRRRRR